MEVVEEEEKEEGQKSLMKRDEEMETGAERSETVRFRCCSSRTSLQSPPLHENSNRWRTPLRVANDRREKASIISAARDGSRCPKRGHVVG